jgi:hypothetical protein
MCRPSGIVIHGDFAMAVWRRTPVESGTPKSRGRITTSDAGFSSAIYQDVRLVLGCDLPSLDKAEKFGAHEHLIGKVAVNAGL